MEEGKIAADMQIHFAFDIAAAIVSTLLFRRIVRDPASVSPLQSEGAYWFSLVLGAIAGAYLFGSLNLSWPGVLRIGHSIAGALAGGIFGVEIFKVLKGTTQSTGAAFVLPLMAGIAVGRIGCFAAGLPDETYGVETDLPWGMDFGDGVFRHPVQLYESIAMVLGAILVLRWRSRDRLRFRDIGFYVFILFYATQRFLWEFLKPYPRIFFQLNLFHIICIVLIIYSFSMMRLNRARNA